MKRKIIPFTVQNFPYDILEHVPISKYANGHPKNKRLRYAGIICTFDIEATNLPDIKQSVMWHWQTCVDGMVCCGRTWADYSIFLEEVKSHLPKDVCIVFYVHNLGY